MHDHRRSPRKSPRNRRSSPAGESRDRRHVVSRLLSRSLASKVVVISGASSGAGRAAASAFASQGAHVVLSSRGDEALDVAAEECRHRAGPNGGDIVAIAADVAEPDDVAALRRAVVDRFGRIDVWVDAASVLIAGPVGAEDTDELRRLVQTNVLGPALVARSALETFRAQGHGTLVLVGSLLGLVPNPVVPYYVMGKFAVRGLALSLRQAMAGHRDIHVSLVMPGPVDTPLFLRQGDEAPSTAGTLFEPEPGPGEVGGGYRIGDARQRAGAAVGRAMGG